MKKRVLSLSIALAMALVLSMVLGVTLAGAAPLVLAAGATQADLQNAINSAAAAPGTITIIDLNGQAIDVAGALHVKAEVTIQNGTINLVRDMVAEAGVDIGNPAVVSLVRIDASNVTLSGLTINGFDAVSFPATGPSGDFTGYNGSILISIFGYGKTYSNITIDNCTLNCGATGPSNWVFSYGNGIETATADTIDGLTFSNSVMTGAETGTSLWPMYINPNVTNLDINNNTFSGNFQRSLTVDSSEGTIRNNTFDMCASTQRAEPIVGDGFIRLSKWGSADPSVSVTGNTFIADPSLDYPQYAVIIGSTSNVFSGDSLVSFTGNDISGLIAAGPAGKPDDVPAIRFYGLPPTGSLDGNSNPLDVAEDGTVFYGPLFTVTFDSAGGTTFSPVTVAAGTITLPTPAKTGYVFDGWKDSSDAVFAGGSSYTVSGNVTLTASWSPATFTATFYVGASVEFTESVSFDTLITDPGTPTVPAGYLFDAWYTDAIGGVEWDFAEMKMPADAVNLYARFTRNSFTVTFHPDGGVPAPAVATVPFEGLITAPTVEKTGYTFAGWWTAATEGTQWNFSVDEMPANNLDLYARWDAVIYGVTFHPRNGDADFGEDVAFDALITAPADPTYVGRTFLGWFTSATGGDKWDFDTMTMPEDGIDLYAQWVLKRFTVTTVVDGTETETETEVEFGKPIPQPPAPSAPPGYRFAGWYCEVKGAMWDFDIDTMPEDGVTLVAQFEANTYNARFDGTNGTPVLTVPGTFGELLTKPSPPTKPGYKFNGWFTAKTGGDKWDFATMTMPVDGITLYAQWTRVDTSGGGGSGSGTGGAGTGGSGTTPPPAVGAPSGTTPRTSDSTTVGFVVAAALIGCVAILGSQVARKRVTSDNA